MLVRHHNKKGTVSSQFFAEYAETKLERLERMAFGVTKVDITTSKEGSFYSCLLYTSDAADD